MTLTDAQREAQTWRALIAPEQQAIMDRYWEDAERFDLAGKKILVVEGDDDVAVIEQALKSLDARADTKVKVVAAGGREQVIRKLHEHATWFGQVDRDTWTDEERQQSINAHQNRLMVTSGWCLENLFLSDHLALEVALKRVVWGRRREGSQVTGVAAWLRQQETAWSEYGALWWVLHRTQESLGRSMQGFRRPLRPGESEKRYYGHPNSDPPQPRDERTLRSEFRDLPGVQAAHLIAEIQRRLQAQSTHNVWEVGIPGKEFFRSQLVPWLKNITAHQQSGAEWLRQLAEQWCGLTGSGPQWPGDLRAFLGKTLQ